MQFDYFRFALRKRKRFSRWIKACEAENLEVIKEYFGYSAKKAKEALEILTNEDIEEIRKDICVGGTK